MIPEYILLAQYVLVLTKAFVNTLIFFLFSLFCNVTGKNNKAAYDPLISVP